MNKYDDIINCEYSGSTSMKKIPLEARAAQFAPFAALTGHYAAIMETARLTSKKIELSTDEQINLSKRLNLAIKIISERSMLSITFFTHDSRKTGGRYVTLNGYIKKYAEYDHTITLSNNTTINVCDIIAIEGEIFDSLFH